eukprot:2107696-Amphidinium_carterae.1
MHSRCPPPKDGMHALLFHARGHLCHPAGLGVALPQLTPELADLLGTPLLSLRSRRTLEGIFPC